MRHIKAMTTTARVPEKAMSTATILQIVGISMTAIGGLLTSISAYVGGDAKMDI